MEDRAIRLEILKMVIEKYGSQLMIEQILDMVREMYSFVDGDKKR